MFFSLLMVVIAVFLAYSVFTGKGKLMAVENIKKDKIGTYKKWLRILYAVMMVIVLLMAFFNFVEKVAYVQTNYYEFTEDYLGADEKVHPAGESHPTDEMIEILIPTESSGGSMCAPVDTSELPYKYTGTTYTLDEKYSFVSFIPYQTARILNFVGLGVSLVVVLALFIFINKMTDKDLQKKNYQKKNSSKGPVRPSMPKGAFDFSDYQDEVEVAADFADETQEIPSKKK